MRRVWEIADGITTWLRDYALHAGADGYIVGLSGGIDSACTAALCRRAMGERVLGLILPCHSSPEDAEMANLVADTLGLKTLEVNLGAAYDAFLQAVPINTSDMAKGNLKPRLRMAACYTVAQTHNYLVAGTGNRSELMVGYFTKYGDGGVDVEPLGQLYKWQVRELALELGIPQPVIDRPPSAGLWQGQTDEEEMGITYDDLDATLAAFEMGDTEGVNSELLQRVQRLISTSDHKRATPPAWPAGS